MSAYFTESNYMIRRKVFKLFGGAFHIYDAMGNVVAYSKMKAFKLKEDFRIYASESMAEEIMRISARNIIDISATYDVIDSRTEERLGALQRRGMKSILRDEWLVLNPEGEEIGKITEDSLGMAILRRALNVVPQTFDCTLHGRKVCRFKQHFNPFVLKMSVEFNPSFPGNKMLYMAAGILLAAIEGRQG